MRRNGKVDSRSARLRLKADREPYWTTLAPGEALGYYRSAQGGAGTWWARVRLENRRYQKASLGVADDFADADGQDVLSFLHAQMKARIWFDRIRAHAGEESPHRGPFTVADAWRLYREDCVRRGVKALDRLESGAKLYILPALGHIEVEKLTQSRIERWQTELAETAPRRRPKRFATEQAKGAKPRTPEDKRKRKASANRVFTILKSALNLAKQKRKVNCTADTWREVKPFGNADAARVRFLNLEEQVRLVNACEPEFRRLVQAGLFTGARFSELVRLRVKDFDSGNGSLFILESKNGKSRHVVLTEEGLAFFSEAIADLKSGDLIFTRRAYKDMRRVAPKTQKPIPKVIRGWKLGDQQRPMLAACESAGNAPMGFHQLRHSYASALVNAGLPLAYIAAQLGHSDTRMVEKHYGHLAPSALKDAIRKLAPKLGIHQPGSVEGLKIKRR
jgi:integrase